MKIGLLILEQLSGKGGMEKVMYDVIQGLEKYGDTSSIYCCVPIRDKGCLDDIKSVINGNIPLFFQKKHFFRPRFIAHLYYRHEIKKLLKKMSQDCDLIILLSINGMFCRNADIFLDFKKSFPHIPIVSWSHFTMDNGNEMNGKLRNALSLCDAHLAISNGITRELRDIFAQDNIYTVFNPVASADLVKRSPRRFIYVGRVVKQKRVIELISNILSKLKGDWHLDIVGGSTEKDVGMQLDDVIKNNHLKDKITVHGWQTAPWTRVYEAGVLLLNSSYEGLPLVLLEAMVRGIPCVSADCPVGPADIVQNGVNGWLYEMNDEKACVDILQGIIDGKIQLPSQEQVQNSVEKFSTENVIKNIKIALDSTLNKKRISLE